MALSGMIEYQFFHDEHDTLTMQFDEAKIYICSGQGGDGMMSFRREKYVPLGGPSGGDGGKGGDVIFRVNPKMNTLLHFHKHVHFRAEPGSRGGSANKTGANGLDLYIDVPRGTLVKNAETDEILADLVHNDDQYVALMGGRGGKGNARFSTSANQAPRLAEKGEPFQENWVKLELKLIADVGLVGVPNAGKSTLLSVLTNAKPKIADYPFTTLEPNLGVMLIDDRDLVIADIPGLIEGAHMGVGLGHAFLRHIQRCRLLVHLIDGMSSDPIADYNQINIELSLFDDALTTKPQIVVFTKMDLPDAQVNWELMEDEFYRLGVTDVIRISSVAHQNLQALQYRLLAAYDALPDRGIPVWIPAEPITATYELEDRLNFRIERMDDSSYRVIGQEIERAARMTYWEYDEAVLRFQKILAVTGITDALLKEGVEVGDTVYIGEFELEWAD